MISAEKIKFDKDLKVKSGQLSEDELNQLMNEHSEHMELLSRNVNMEKERQLNSLSDKIAQRRKMKADILARRHDAEMAKELVKQRGERNTLEDDHVSHSIYTYYIHTLHVCCTVLYCNALHYTTLYTATNHTLTNHIVTSHILLLTILLLSTIVISILLITNHFASSFFTVDDLDPGESKESSGR